MGSEMCIRDRKVQVGLCKGKKLYDKRADMAARDAQRDIQRALKEKNR